MSIHPKRTRISAKKFKECNYSKIENYIVNEPIQFSKNNCNELVIINCELDFLELDEVIAQSLRLEDCKIINLVIKNCDIRDITLSNCRGGRYTLASPQHPHNFMIIGDKTIIRKIDFDDYLFEEFKIYDGRFQEITLYRPNGRYLMFGGLTNSKKTKFNRTIKFFQKDEQVSIYDAAFFEIDTYEFDLGGCKFSSVDFEKTSGNVDISNGDLGECFFGESQIRKLVIRKVKANLIFQQTSFDHLEFAEYNNVNLTCFNSPDNPMTIDLLIFNRFFPNRDNKLAITDCNVNYLHFYHSNLVGLLHFNSIVVNKEFGVYFTNLGKSFLNLFVIQPDCRVSFVASEITESLFSNFMWQGSYRLQFNQKDGSTDLNSRILIRESYRQLKTAFTKSGNKIEALEFHKLEMETHYEVVKKELFSKSHTNLLNKIGNFLIVGTHKWFSGYSQNIFRPFFLLFLVHLLLFNILLYRVNLGITWSWNFDQNATMYALNKFCSTILPTHGFTLSHFLTKEDTPIGGWVDLLMRVSSGYFIFYFITASRKYHHQ